MRTGTNPLSQAQVRGPPRLLPGMLGIAVSTTSVNVTTSHALAHALSDRVLDAHELGEIYLRRPAATIFKDLTRAPHRLPPSIRIPGRRGRVWLESEVLRWLRSHLEVAQTSEGEKLGTPIVKGVATSSESVATDLQRRVGRPTKRQQLARLAAAREGK